MSKETDKELSDLYLARSEGKITQRKIAGSWIDSADWINLHHADRIRPQTVEEAAYKYSHEAEPTNWLGKTLGWKLQEAVKFGAQWRDENPKELGNE